MANFLTTQLSGLIIAVVAAYFTVQFSLRRFRSEKWWEKKVEAYEKVLDALYCSKSFFDNYLAESYGDRKLTDEAVKKLRKDANLASDEIERLSNLGAFLLSGSAMARLSQYLKEEQEASKTTHWVEYLDGNWTAVSACLNDIIDIAKKDLEVEPFSIGRWWKMKFNKVK